MRDADHTPPSSVEVKKELSYTSSHPMGPSGPVMGFPLPPFTGKYVHTTSQIIPSVKAGRLFYPSLFLIYSHNVIMLRQAINIGFRNIMRESMASQK